MRYFLDTYALIEIAEGNPSHQKYVQADAVTLKENLVEMFYFLLKKHDEQTAAFFVDAFARIAVELPVSIIAPAMLFRYQHAKTRFSYIDCLGYAYAQEQKRIFVTGDRAFKDREGVEIVR